MTDIELLPLPEADGFMETFDTYGYPVGSEDAWGEETVKETIRANVAHATAAKDAEIEALRDGLDYIANMSGAADILELRAKAARAERLAETLRLARDLVEDWAGYASEYFQKKHNLEGDLALLDAALRDHDQEGTNDR